MNKKIGANVTDPETGAKSCFVISPIGSSGSDIRKRADQVLKHILRPPLEAAGYKVVRADTIDDPGMITTQIIDRIMADQLVVADLSGHNPNVFYELAVRHGLGKPIIHIHNSEESIPFDVAGARSIPFDYKDLDSAAQAREDIARQIEVIEHPDFRPSNPLSFSFDMKALENGGDREELYISKIMAMVSSQQRQLSKIEDRLSRTFEVEAIQEENNMLRMKLYELEHRLVNDMEKGVIRTGLGVRPSDLGALKIKRSIKD